MLLLIRATASLNGKISQLEPMGRSAAGKLARARLASATANTSGALMQPCAQVYRYESVRLADLINRISCFVVLSASLNIHIGKPSTGSERDAILISPSVGAWPELRLAQREAGRG